jgi:hypothetical protein
MYVCIYIYIITLTRTRTDRRRWSKKKERKTIKGNLQYIYIITKKTCRSHEKKRERRKKKPGQQKEEKKIKTTDKYEGMVRANVELMTKGRGRGCPHHIPEKNTTTQQDKTAKQHYSAAVLQYFSPCSPL